MSQEGKKLFLLDAMALIYRAYYALNRNPRITSKGLNTSAILGFANALYDVIRNEKPSHIGVAFDTHAPTVRHEDFTAYKANREAMPEDIAAAIPYIIQLIRGFNIPVLAVDGYEADDVIGTLAKQAEKKGFTVYMMTPDKDFGQLVSDNILQYKPGKPGEDPVIMGVKEVCDKFGVKRPDQVIDMLGLWGDASDNIPGIPGVGEVIARNLLKDFDNVENLIENAEKIDKAGLREKVKTFGQQALMSKQLATIILDVPIAFEEDALKLTAPDITALKTLFEEIEFRTFAKRVFSDLEKSDVISGPRATDLFAAAGEPPETTTSLRTISQAPHQYHLTDTPEKIKALVAHLSQSQMFCFDTETTGLDANNVELVGMSFATEPGEAWFVPVPEQYSKALEIVKEFAGVFADETIGKTGQNMKYDISVLKWYEITVNGTLFDTMIAHYLIEPDMRHNMDFLARTYLNYEPVSIESLIGKKGKNQLSMRSVDPEKLKEYACEDADITLQLRIALEPQLADTDTRALFDEIEMPLVKVLAAMEAEGVKIDSGNLNQFSEQLEKEIAEVEKEIFRLAGEEFNIASPKQLGEVIFDKMQLSDNPKQTKTKQHSTSEDVLQKLINKHPIVQQILDYRSLTKLKSTYVDTLPLLVNPRTGRIHTSYNQAVASTGRLSSNNPNLQNIPIRTERGREIRKAFVPRNDKFVLLSADYSQIELRLIAHISGDEAMQEAFRHGIDIHTATAARIYNIDISEVTKEMRRNAKTVNFGIIYGISAFGLSERLNIPRREAAEIISQYFERFAGIKRYMDEIITFAREHGYVETIKKRRRYLRDINSGNAIVRGFAERNAINAPIQGSSADMIKIAMISIQREFERLKLKSRMIMQVHDELVFDVHQDEVETVKPVIERLMKSAIELSIPVEVEMSTGSNWLEAH
ncbi:DNA polymerase I [Lentimicrobium sp.]|uniref:DNA polymerase I n=2 Tax=Lentimicrobium sp. TaxID=2034841 RepID=UPI002C07C3A4|nr:DNA polymerase I [Lentimicrobium sp.]HPF64370.1 DNA polymerase I [Lentimicrobium sp.]HPJ61589.1 DNA polymerase I [Lentimicrobium sp.]HRW69082.1 DNA polymerase I [Lentimicrobium sp.]